MVNSPPLATAAGRARQPQRASCWAAGSAGRTLATVDDWALRPLADLHVDVAFMATNGCSVERGPDHAGPGRGRGQAGDDRARPGARCCSPTTPSSATTTWPGSPTLADIDLLITDTGLDADARRPSSRRPGPEVVRA